MIKSDSLPNCDVNWTSTSGSISKTPESDETNLTSTSYELSVKMFGASFKVAVTFTHLAIVTFSIVVCSLVPQKLLLAVVVIVDSIKLPVFLVNTE